LTLRSAPTWRPGHFTVRGADAWAERARQELRAAGERSDQPTPRALNLLAPQELQIARMAAEGLGNREIGQQLYLSHRTVRNHLYRIFPKLGITSRAELAAAVSDRTRSVAGSP
jgi:DNA-binding NarL/FixJ family response regulator